MLNSMVASSLSQSALNQEMKERMAANALFTNVKNRGKLVMLLKKLFGQQNGLQPLMVENKSIPLQKDGNQVVTILIEKIVGSEGRAHDFDKNFRPLVNHIRDRWVGIAVARRNDIPLPPVELIQVGDEYYVRDGNHRISVAKVLGQATIEARITHKLA